MSRKGREINQTSGKSTSASKANGQHKKKRMHQATRNMSVFMFLAVNKAVMYHYFAIYHAGYS